jgi:hypothetical protein
VKSPVVIKITHAAIRASLVHRNIAPPFPVFRIPLMVASQTLLSRNMNFRNRAKSPASHASNRYAKKKPFKTMIYKVLLIKIVQHWNVLPNVRKQVP